MKTLNATLVTVITMMLCLLFVYQMASNKKFDESARQVNERLDSMDRAKK